MWKGDYMRAPQKRSGLHVDEKERERLLRLKQSIDQTLRGLVGDYRRLEHLNRQLEWKARTTEQELERSQSQLRSAHKDITVYQKREANFLHFLFKGLKSPLHLIERHIVQLSANGAREQEKEDSLNELRDEVHRLWQIIEDLDVMEEVQLGRVQIKQEKVDLKEVVVGILEEHRQAALGQHVGLSEDIDGNLPAILGDREQLRLALHHLVDNAIAHSPAGGTVTVQANGEHPEGRVSLNIIDMRKDIIGDTDLEILKGQFPAGGAAKLNVQGFDLELMAAGQIIAMHQGQIAVKSQQGGGMVFTLTLPVGKELMS
jgi:K+-sensing histidine kinase KdpD